MTTTTEDFVPLDGGYGWIILAACTLINSTVQPLLQCFALIFENTFAIHKIKAAQISFLLHLHNSIMCSLGFLSAPVLKKYNYQQLAFVATSLICIGIFATSFVHTYASLIVTVCIIIGIGQGILMPSISLAINSYFKKRLTLAMSYSITGVGLLPIFVPAVCNYLLNIYGTSGTILLLTGLAMHAFIGVLLLKPVNIPKIRKDCPLNNVKNVQEEEALVKTDETTVEIRVINGNLTKEEDNKVYPKKIRKKLEKLSDLFDLELFKDKQFVSLVLGMGISYAAELNFLLMVPFVLYEMAKFERKEVAMVMSIQSAFDIFGRLALPVLAHKSGLHPRLMYAVTLIGSSIGRTILAIFCDTGYVVLACSALWGLSKGGKAVFQSLILPRHVPYEKLATAFGVQMIINGFLSLMIGPFIGWVHDINQSYKVPLHVTTTLSLLCVVLWLCTYCCFQKEVNNTNEINNENNN